MSRGLRVLHLNTERTWRGGERQSLWLARELQRRGHENWMACRPGFPLEKAARDAGLDIVPVRPWTEAGLCSAYSLRRFLRERRVDVLHAHTGHAVGLGALAALGTGAAFLATRRVDFPLQAHAFSRWKYGRLDGLVAISLKVQEVLRRGGFPPSKTSVIPSGIDSAGYPSAGDRDRFRREAGYAPGDALVVNAAALVPHKDQDTLLRAARAVCEALPAARFLILGEGPLRAALERTAKDLGLEGRVSFLGHRPDVLKYIAMADLFALSSSEEGLGTSLLDALAVGVPTAATRAGGIPEIYGGGAAPELSPPKDPEALARNILSVLRDPEEARRRVSRGRELVARFTVESMAGRYEEVYENMLRGRRGVKSAGAGCL